jgi:hypothetical protein
MTEAEWWRLMFLSLTRAMCLADHMGDAWGSFHDAWELAGLGEIPMREDGDGMPDMQAIEAMGGRCFWVEPKMPPREPDAAS